MKKAIIMISITSSLFAGCDSGSSSKLSRLDSLSNQYETFHDAELAFFCEAMNKRGAGKDIEYMELVKVSECFERAKDSVFFLIQKEKAKGCNCITEFKPANYENYYGSTTIYGDYSPDTIGNTIGSWADTVVFFKASGKDD